MLASLDATDVRGRLSSFQAGVRAGREVAPAELAPRGASSADSTRTKPADETLGAQASQPHEEETAESAGSVETVQKAVPETAQKRDENADTSALAVPVRVRGAQLPDLGLIENSPDTYLSPSAEANRWKLRSFQLDVDAARRAGGTSADDASQHPNTSEEA